MPTTTEPITTESTDSLSSGHETTQTFASSGDVTPQHHVVTSHRHVVTSTTSMSSTTTTPTLMSSTDMEVSSTNHQQSITTTQSPLSWKDVSFGLIGGLAVLLLVCIVLVVVICRLRRRLKKAHVTLYPMAPAKERTYTPLAPTAKKSLDLEMARVSQIEDVEEVDSPTFSTPPPAPNFPPRSVIQSLPDKPPELPSRRPNRKAPSGPGKQVQTKVQHKPQYSADSKNISVHLKDDQEGGVENIAFTKEANTTLTGNAVESDTENEDDDSTYESYDVSMYQNIMKLNIQEDTDGIAMPYEVPVISNKVRTDENKDFIRRQSSSSGLPEMVFNINETGESDIDSHDAPLPTDQDIYDNEEVEFKLKDTGLPTGNAISDMHFQEDYEDVQTADIGMSQNTGRNSSIDYHAGGYTDSSVIDMDAHLNKDFLDRQNSSSGLPDMTVHINETSGNDINDRDIECPADSDLYDDVPIENDYLDLNDNEVREDVENKDIQIPRQEKVLFTGSNIDTLTDSKQDISVAVLDADEDMVDRNSLYDTMRIGAKIDSELEGEPDIYEDPNEDIPSQYIKSDSIGSLNSEQNGEKINRDHGGTTVSEHNILPSAVGQEQMKPEACLLLPKVPPRRDLMTQLPGPPLITYNQDNIQQEDTETMNPASVAISDVERRPGKQINDIKSKASLQNSYFLDMEDGSKEISETHHKRISVHKMGDKEMSLTDLVHLYNSEKTNDDSNTKFDIETETVTSEDKIPQSQTSNGILANGNGVCIIDDEDLYDVPPPIHHSESSA